ncbi:CDP-alcohol phosphatidyltransferase family protein [Actinomadura madurae]|uniref:CDP-alcohol phosphatidyltransferase family protein n=1 Tax=Actinomadura madurae TaxID=1993 RepID=UPI0020D24051|nr:CDP-alcohol phosphatidyltransferase family protein [Actinomadura madurae]MCP9949155.1 CDP-alcohol phosphatidyltransferase family protein [Actinomadura madurae]MCP9978398.1 CDP-alcohol phosphatidyltransferase family protein [Actinomadura madurae]
MTRPATLTRPVAVRLPAAPPPRRPRLTRGPELAAAVAVQLALLALLRPGYAGLAVGVLYALASWGILGRAFRRRRTLGPADHVTLARVVLTGGVAALVAGHLTGGGNTWALVAVASLALVLDGVDGQVARRTGTASKLGARFDMETDAFLVLVLSVEVAWSAGAWVLAIGAMRYLFGAAAWAAPWLRADLPPSVARKAVAVVQGVALVVAAAGVVPLSGVLVAAALGLLLWSFGRDVLWLVRRHRAARPDGHGIRGTRGRSTDGARGARLLDPVAR